MAVQSDAGASRASPRFEQPSIRLLELHRGPSGPIRGVSPVTAAEVTDGRQVPRDDGRTGHTGADQQEGNDGIA